MSWWSDLCVAVLAKSLIFVPEVLVGVGGEDACKALCFDHFLKLFSIGKYGRAFVLFSSLIPLSLTLPFFPLKVSEIKL